MKNYIRTTGILCVLILSLFYILSGCRNDPLTPETSLTIDKAMSLETKMNVTAVNPDISTVTVSQSTTDTTEISIAIDPASVELSVQATNQNITLLYYTVDYFDPVGNQIDQSTYSFKGELTQYIQLDTSTDTTTTTENKKEETVSLSVFSHKIMNYATNALNMDSTTHISPITASIKIWAQDTNGLVLADTAHCTLVTAVQTQ